MGNDYVISWVSTQQSNIEIYKEAAITSRCMSGEALSR